MKSKGFYPNLIKDILLEDMDMDHMLCLHLFLLLIIIFLHQDMLLMYLTESPPHDMDMVLPHHIDDYIELISVRLIIY